MGNRRGRDLPLGAQLSRMKKFLRQNRVSLVAVLILFFLGVFSSKGIFTYYAFSTHDSDYQLARCFDAIATLKEGHFPLHWAGSLNYGCGVPIYNFYYPLIYYLVFLLHFLVGDVILAWKYISAASLIIGPIFFYLWLLKETKNSIASWVGGILYLFVPYRFLLVYVRGNPEFLSYTLLPALLYLISQLYNTKLEGKKAFLIGLAVAVAGAFLIIAHNIAAMLLVPIVAFYVSLKLISQKIFNKKKIIFLLFVFSSFFGLSSFFLGPALLEQGNVKLGMVQTVNFRDHFPTLRQLVRSPWGYFYSQPGSENDGMSFMLGYAQWLVLGVVGLFLLKTFLEYKNKQKWFKENCSTLFWFFVSLMAIFLIMSHSLFLWERIKILQQVQYSWRFLGITSFSLAALGGFSLSRIKNRLVFGTLAFFFVSLAIVGNRNHLLPMPVMEIQQYYNFERNHPVRYSTTTIGDEILNKESPKPCAFDELLISSGNETAFDYQTERGNTFGKITFASDKERQMDIRLNLEYFPGAYKLAVNNQPFKDYFNCSGRICLSNVKINEKNNLIEWKIVQTPTQKAFNLVSLFFLFLWLALIFK